MTLSTPIAAHRRQIGVSLVELMTVLAVIAVVIGTALPSFTQAAERHRVEGAAAQLETDIHFMRSLAVTRGQSLRVSFTSAAANSGNSCYVIHTGPANACQCNAQGSPVCTAKAESLRTVAFTDQRVSVKSNASSFLVDAVRGTVTPTATMQVQSNAGRTLNVVVNIMGRVRSCAASAGLPGHVPC